MDKKPKVYIKSSRDDKVTVKKIMMERESMYVPNDAFKNVSLNHIKVFSTGRDILLSTACLNKNNEMEKDAVNAKIEIVFAKTAFLPLKKRTKIPQIIKIKGK